MTGQDTQNIMGEEDANSSMESPSKLQSRPVLDGTLCEEPGQIKQEFLSMMEQHEKDIADERKREETASASLIQQMQDEEDVQRPGDEVSVEEDYLLAQKLQEEFEKEDRRQRSTQLRSTQKPFPRNLMKEWTSPNNAYSPDITELPLNIQSKMKRANLSLNAGKSAGKKANVRKRKPSATVTSSDVSRASQDMMNKFLTSSQNQLVSPSSSSPGASADPMTPCCSKSLPVHDVRFSAFSPTKPSTNSRLIFPVESLAIPISCAAGSLTPISNRTSEEPGTSTKTPDSINSEVDHFFRPIRGAPKTPPRRRPDGTFLPEPKLLRTTPMKPGVSTTISAYIRSPLKQMPDESRPSCATIEKRISNDSGRASDDSRSPDVEGIGESPTTSLKGSDNASLKTVQSYQTERGRISEDYRVTPEDNPKTPENSKKRFLVDDNENISSDSKKVRVEPIRIDSLDLSPTRNELIVEEEGSPSLLNEPFGHVPLSFEITCTQGILTIEEDDEEYLDQEAEALKSFRKKAEQEAADRAYAQALQKEFNKSVRSPRGGNLIKKHSLRSWLSKPQVKVEINDTTGPDE